MANEYAIFTTPWMTAIEDGEIINLPQLRYDYPYTNPDGVSRWQDVTGNNNGVDPNQYQIEVWCNTATMDAIEADPTYVMSPGSWSDLDGIVEE
jgi:hypothetical protein